jgi:hypothetical protein
MLRMADAEVLTCQGTPLITWKAPKPSYRLDTKRLSIEHPELIKQYQSPIQNSRRFVVRDVQVGSLLGFNPTNELALGGDHART